MQNYLRIKCLRYIEIDHANALHKTIVIVTLVADETMCHVYGS